MKLFFASGVLLLLGLVTLSSCAYSSSRLDTYYPQKGDEERYRSSHHASLKDELADDEGTILQSHTDARQGLYKLPDQPGVSNDGTGWTTYR